MNVIDKSWKGRVKIVKTVFLLIFLGFTGCTFENRLVNELEPTAGDLWVSLPFLSQEKEVPEGENSSSARAKTEELGDADGDFNENKVENVSVFFFPRNPRPTDETLWLTHEVVVQAKQEETKGRAEFLVPHTIKELLKNQLLTIYVVANANELLEHLGSSTTLANLQNVRLTENFEGGGNEDTNGVEPRKLFVMEGVIHTQLDFTATGRLVIDEVVPLRRVLAKLRIRLYKSGQFAEQVDAVNAYIKANGGELDGYTGASPKVSLVNYNASGYLLKEEVITESLHASEYHAIHKPVGGAIGLSTPAPFYSYANDWNREVARETYFNVEIPWFVKNEEGGYSFSHLMYYKIPVSYQPPGGATNAQEKNWFRLIRNNLYEVQVHIAEEGTPKEEPLELKDNLYIIKEWTTRKVDASIPAWHYLVATPREGILLNETTFWLDYSSSKMPVWIKEGSIQATFTYTRPDGIEVTEEVPVGSNQYPRFTFDSPRPGKLAIGAAIPINTVAKKIQFTLTNGIEGLDVPITLIQYPKLYVDNTFGVASSQRPSGDFDFASNESNLKNKALYRITTVAPTGDDVMGYPPRDANGYTLSNAETARMISPSFMLASQLGAVTPFGYWNDAQNHCANYWERTIVNGKEVYYNDFRLPTVAELNLLDRLQGDPNSKVDEVIAGQYYWANTPERVYINSSTVNGVFVRCVRDVR